MPAFPGQRSALRRFVQPRLIDSSAVVCTASLERGFCSLTELTSRKDFLVISLNFPLLAFIPSLISYNPLAHFSSVKWPKKPTSSSSEFPISSPVAHPSLSPSLTVSPDRLCPCVLGVIPLGEKAPWFPKPAPAEQRRAVSEFAGASKNSGQDPANSIPEEIRLLGSQDCLLCSQL